MSLSVVFETLNRAIQALRFSEPVTHVYNPLQYARKPHARYLELYGQSGREILLLGMNPGPFGMAQTGVPFGEIDAVRDWLGIDEPVSQPAGMHPKRPIEGFDCSRSEVSGRRLWGWARNRFGTPQAFFERYFVANYCPLVFIEASGRNRTPDKLPKSEREPLFDACNRALADLVEHFQPRYLIGVGAFAEKQAKKALSNQSDIIIGRITHPSPANPRANRGWVALIEAELAGLGILE